MKIRISTYAELARFGGLFASGKFPLMVVVGTGGIGKSSEFKSAAPEAKVIEGEMTPIGLYEWVYRAENSPIILDDIDGLYKIPAAVRLLKAICQSEPTRHVVWATATKHLEKNGIPREYHTSSPICIIANEWRELNRNVQAVGDRGLVIEFEPSAEAVHEQAKSWFTDVQVYDFVGDILHLVRRPSFRMYSLASMLREAGDDWRTRICQEWNIDEKIVAVADILRDKELKTSDERVEAFRARTGGSRATYMRYQKALRDAWKFRKASEG